jgi:hypothetical protein
MTDLTWSQSEAGNARIVRNRILQLSKLRYVWKYNEVVVVWLVYRTRMYPCPQLQLQFILRDPPTMKKLLGVFARAQASGSPRVTAAGAADGQAKRWGGFLLPLAAPQPIVPANQEVLKEVDTVVRGIAARVKAAYVGWQCMYRLLYIG